MIFFKLITTYFFYFFFFTYVFSKEMIFEDFSKNSGEINWEFITDQVMGGISSGSFNILKETNISFLRMTGKVRLENNGGFIQVRKTLSLHKNKDFSGIKLKCRGNNNKYFIHIRTKFTLLPWQYYQSKFFASENWQEHKLDLNSFERSGALLPRNINSKHIKSIALVAFGRKHRVNLEVSEINFF